MWGDIDGFGILPFGTFGEYIISTASVPGVCPVLDVITSIVGVIPASVSLVGVVSGPISLVGVVDNVWTLSCSLTRVECS
jgi:hypothetical protein